MRSDDVPVGDQRANAWRPNLYYDGVIEVIQGPDAEPTEPELIVTQYGKPLVQVLEACQSDEDWLLAAVRAGYAPSARGIQEAIYAYGLVAERDHIVHLETNPLFALGEVEVATQWLRIISRVVENWVTELTEMFVMASHKIECDVVDCDSVHSNLQRRSIELVEASDSISALLDGDLDRRRNRSRACADQRTEQPSPTTAPADGERSSAVSRRSAGSSEPPLVERIESR